MPNNECQTAIDPNPQSRPVPTRYRWLKRLIKSALVILAGLVIIRIAWGCEANRRLQQKIQHYHDLGQPVFAKEFDQLLDSIPDENNKAIPLETAMTKTVGTAASGTYYSDFVVNRKLFQEKANDAAELYKANKTVLDIIRQARLKPQVAWSSRLKNAMSGQSVNLGSHQRALAKLLYFAGGFELNNRNYNAAIETITDLLDLCQAIERQPFVISTLSSQAFYSLTSVLIEDLIADLRSDKVNANLNTSQINNLITILLNETDTRNAAINALQGERAAYLLLLENIDNYGITGSMSPAWWDRAACFLRKPAVVLDVTEYMTLNEKLSKALNCQTWSEAKLVLPHKEETRSLLHSLTHPITDTPYTQPNELAQQQMKLFFAHLAERRLTATGLAILLFENEHQTRPRKLQDLVPEFLPYIPLDPFAAGEETIKYLPDVPNPILYSLGPDGDDDGGIDKFNKNRTKNGKNWDLIFNLSGSEKYRKARQAVQSSQSNQAGDNHN